MNKNLEIEKAVMKAMLDGKGEGIDLLRSQYLASYVSNIEETGHGIYFTYSQDDYSGMKFTNDFPFGDVIINQSDPEESAGAIIFVKNGILKTLELFSYGDEWLVTVDKVELSYKNQKRDFSDIEAAL